MKKSFIFDLDGVIVDTAKFHFFAWKNLAEKLGIPFTEKDNEQLKGVSRIQSLEKILALGNKQISAEEFQQHLFSKNEEYLSYVRAMIPEDILPGVVSVLNYLKQNNHPVALGSASKNARTILEKVQLSGFFDTVVDGNDVSKAKPDPEVFLRAAHQLGAAPENCIVFEDSIAGIQAANMVKMTSVGIGEASVLKEADFIFTDFSEISNHVLEQIKEHKKAY